MSTFNLEKELNIHFGYQSFRLGQKEIIEDVMTGNDVMGVLPTGSGKSICYQLPAMLLEGITVVVSPLISLMMDQVKQLKAINIKGVIAVNSFMDIMERRTIWNEIHRYKLIYISPELLQRPEVQRKLKQVGVRLFVVDEAHCISQWGHEFRPDYLKLRKIISNLDDPVVLALSATATTGVQQDILGYLDKPNMKKHIYPIDKPNIAFNVEHMSGDKEKQDKIVSLLKSYYVPTIIYFSSRLDAENISALLSMKTDRRVAFYHGGMEPQDRIIIQQQFMNGQLDAICCTSAFGMGINKKDVRLIVHYHLTPQLEAYIQEVGRAGRDNKSSVSLLLFSEGDVYLPKNIMKSELPTNNEIALIFRQLKAMHDEGKTLSIKDQENFLMFQISEPKWRFLRYQLEKHDILRANNIKFDQEIWKAAYLAIRNKCEERLNIKEKQLQSVINWIYYTGCLRKKLYQDFQHSSTSAMDQCCSNCGFSWENWQPEQLQQEQGKVYSWEEKLKKLLLVNIE
ncbi:RecQ family ATP-dependent DNA helicase [Oceanobacillus manasiensis]|uniref:RecQ family ATP-dependent DNA helicase n=1 Tax=Oceanobacillus manasiensis TaxID=586413 RepID=UPI0005A6FF4A|nr:RecQ family ATP-dependent DNA helicase [Oceanobacillus manasiensis]